MTTARDSEINILLDEILRRVNPLPRRGEDPRVVEKGGLHRAAFHDKGEECLGCWLAEKIFHIKAYLGGQGGPMVDVETGKIIDVIPDMPLNPIELGPGEIVPTTPEAHAKWDEEHPA